MFCVSPDYFISKLSIPNDKLKSVEEYSNYTFTKLVYRLTVLLVSFRFARS